MVYKTLEAIREGCEACGGTGVTQVPTDTGVRLEDCKCIRKVSHEIALIKANIPKKYRDFTFKNLTKEFKEYGQNEKQLDLVYKYRDNIVENVKKGRGIWFMSAPGLAKSSIICALLKHAVKEGLTAYFERASHLLSLKFEALGNEEAREKLDMLLNSVDILAIEEIEKIHLINHDSFQSQLFYEFLSDLYDANKALLISSNEPRDKVSNRFPAFIQDRFRGLQTIYFLGASGRANREWEGQKDEPENANENEDEIDGDTQF